MLTKTSAYSVFVRVPICLLIFSLLWVGLFAKRGVLDLRRMQRDSEEMNKKILVAKSERDKLLRRMESLQTSTEEQERVIREVLGYVKPNEMVIEF